jgi:hypothetical protein
MVCYGAGPFLSSMLPFAISMYLAILKLVAVLSMLVLQGLLRASFQAQLGLALEKRWALVHVSATRSSGNKRWYRKLVGIYSACCEAVVVMVWLTWHRSLQVQWFDYLPRRVLSKRHVSIFIC